MMIDRELDRRIPIVEETEDETPEESSGGSVGRTFWPALLGAVTLLAFLAAAAFLAWVLAGIQRNPAAWHPEPMDGSGAGANAVTFEEIEAEASRDGK